MQHTARPPFGYWGIPLGVAALRMLPALWLTIVPPPPGQSYLGVTYLPKDFLQYAAFARQLAVEGTFPFHNPFTTEPQDGRFVLLFHASVGLLSGMTGLSPTTVLEWSRVPLLFVFFAALWWFLRPILADPKDRVAAGVLVGFAAGVESLLRPFSGMWLPETWELRFLQDTSPLHGWSTFASFYNPLWIAGLTLALVVLRPLLFQSARSERALATSAAALMALCFVHPYSAVGVLAIAAAHPVAKLAVGERVDWRRTWADAAGVGGALALVGAISLWQLEDPVYRRSVGGVLGSQNLSALWYPLTLGGLGVLAAVGVRRWLGARHPARAAVLGWIAAVATLHSLPVLNGYKFVFLLPLPLCILAGPVARDLFARRGLRRRALGWLAAVALFAGSLLQTAEAVRTARSIGAIPTHAMSLVERLAAAPPAHAFVPAGLGNVLPAFTSHRVFVGHWFLTPGFTARARTFERVTSQAGGPELESLLRTERIRYLVVPAERSEAIAMRLGERVLERHRHGGLELLVLAEGLGLGARRR